MKTISYILLLFFCSCVGHKTEDSTEIVPVELHNVSKSIDGFIDKLEIVPLETNDSSLISNCRKVVYDKKMDMYAVLDSRFIVFLFSGDGKFIASSAKMQGDGPKQYQLIVDMRFNPFYNGIDLLNPYGTIYTYDQNFQLIAKKKLEDNKHVYMNFMPIDSNRYMLSPSVQWDDGSIYLADYQKRKIVDKISYKEKSLASFNVSDEAFYMNNSNAYLAPHGINYYLYHIDTQKHLLEPIIKLDFGEETIDETKLPGMAQKDVKESTKKNFKKQLRERNQYIMEKSKDAQPLIKFLNDDFVYVYYKKEDVSSNFIYNRKTKEKFLQRNGSPIDMFPCFGLSDNVLLGIISVNVANTKLDNRYLSPKDIQKIKGLKEDDNLIIIKYYLKK